MDDLIIISLTYIFGALTGYALGKLQDTGSKGRSDTEGCNCNVSIDNLRYVDEVIMESDHMIVGWCSCDKVRYFLYDFSKDKWNPIPTDHIYASSHRNLYPRYYEHHD